MERKQTLATIYEKDRDAFETIQISRFGQRYTDYRRLWQNSATELPELSFPLYITIETALHCNLACISCIHGPLCTELKKKIVTTQQNAFMPESIFDRIMDQARQHGLASIGLNWLGEPTLRRNIDERIEKCRSAGVMDIIMSSNGTAMVPDLSERIIRAGLTHMLFSIDAATEETYRKVRLGGDFGKMNRNINEFIRIRNESFGGVVPIVRASLVPTKKNQHEIKAFIDTYTDVVDYVEIQPFGNYYDYLDDIIPDGAEQTPFRCEEVFKKLTIDTDGNILPCCSIHGRNIVLGNVMKDDLKDIFRNHPVLKSLRRDSLSGVYSRKECRQCQRGIYRLKGRD